MFHETSNFAVAASELTVDDFSLEKHKRIWLRMTELAERGEKIDRVTLANLLMDKRQLESVDGLSYLIELDSGLPQIFDLHAYVRIIKEKAALRRIVYNAHRTLEMALGGAHSADNIVNEATAGFLEIRSVREDAGLTTIQSIIQGHPGQLQGIINPSNYETGIPTGFVKYDNMTGGLHKGDLFILAGRPSMGKTALAMNIAEHVGMLGSLAVPNPVVAVFSLEMGKEALLSRMISSSGRVDSIKMRLGYTNQEERRRLQQAALELAETRIRIDDSAALTVFDIESRLRRLKAEEGDLSLVVIDYLQLIHATQNTRRSRNDEVSAISRGLKLMAKDLDVPMIVLSQLSRGPESRPGNHRPLLSDLRESGSLEQDADVVGFVYREEVYNRDREDLKGQAKLILAKQRNGPIGDINLVFLKEFTKFENPLEDLGDHDGGA